MISRRQNKAVLTAALSMLFFLVAARHPVLSHAKTSPQVQLELLEPRIEVAPGSRADFTVQLVVPDDHHAYINSGDEGFFLPIEFDFAELEKGGYKVNILKSPEGEREEKVKAVVLRGKGEYKFSIEATAASPESKSFPISVQTQICNDVTNICLPPQTASLSLPVSFAGGKEGGSVKAGTAQKSAQVSAPAENVQEADGEGVTGWLLGKYRQYSRNIIISFIFMILAGLLSAATPCVYPMLPITSAILVQRGGGSREEGVRHSLLYFTGIILTYIVMGYVAGMTGGALNTIMRSAAVNLLFAVFFALFALSMLGFYDFALGQDFTAKIDSSVSSKAGYTGTFLMGMVAGLVVSPCVGPVVFALLLQVANRIAEFSAELVATGQVISPLQKSLIAGKGGLLMGGFGIGIGIPFLLVGLFSNKMPRAGTWMIYVKYVLGFAILYFAFSYYMKGMGVARVKPDVAYGILLGVVSIFTSIYMGLFTPWVDKGGPNEKLKKAFSIILFIFGFHFFFNGLGQSGLLLESNGSARIVSTTGAGEGEGTEKHGNLVWQRDLEKAKSLAMKEKKPVFIDFYADWCANCIAFKKLSVSNDELNQALQKAILLKIYDSDELFKKFQEDPKYAELKTGLPFFVILRPDGEFFWKGTQYDAVNTMKKMIETAR